MSLRSPVATLFAVALLQAGCTSDGGVQCFGIMKNNVCYPYGSFEDTTGGCTSDQECLPTGVCLEGACGQQCTSDAQCLNGYECRTYRCEPRGRGPEDVTTPGDTSDAVPCRNHLDCEPLDLACINGFCAAECKEDWHCDDPGLVCEHYRCVSAGGPGEDTVEPPEDTTGCPPADGGYGDVCACKEQCATQLCVQNFLTGQNTCSMLCVADSSCPGTDICVTIDPSTKICYANDAGVTPPTCNPDQAGCLKGLVLSNLLGQCVCTVPCTGAAADCPQGMACHFDQGSGLKVCVAVGGFCATGNNPCFSAACLGDGATGYCSAICLGAADCPPGWTCQAVQGGNACVKP